MLDFEYTEVMNFHGALRGMRNPKDSWHLSDSEWGKDDDGTPFYIIGEKDMKLAQTLIKAGGEHRKFMRQISVCVDITAPRYWWTEFDTYKIGTAANSCSTMHKITAYPFTPEMFEIDSGISELDEEYIRYVLRYLELLRLKCINAKDSDEYMNYFRRIKQALPESFKQKRTVTMNYENLYNICNQRKSHRLVEWKIDFITWAKSLPYAEEMIFVR